jgi:hypothetical protein
MIYCCLSLCALSTQHSRPAQTMTGLKTSQVLGNFGAFAAFRKALSDVMRICHQKLRILPLATRR